MGYYLSRQAALKWLESPSVYLIPKDELFELDEGAFRFLRECAENGGCSSKDTAFIDYCREEGLLTTETVSTRRSPLAQAPAPSLRYLELQVTDACNLRCRHCYSEPAGRHLPAEQVSGILQEFEQMQGLRVLITGGEPLLHPRFEEINEMLPDFALRRVLFTNGVLFKNGLLSRLKVHEIQISVDGIGKNHDTLRGEGTYERALHALRQAQDAGFEVSVATMVHAGNLGDFDEMESLFRSMDVREWTVDVPCESGRMRKNPDLKLSAAAAGKYLAYGYGGGMHTTEEGHGCGHHLMAVLADGRAAKCTFYGDRTVGPVSDGLAACWKRIEPVRLETLSCDCEFLSVCRGGCRYRAEQAGSRTGRDPYRCALYGIMKKE